LREVILEVLRYDAPVQNTRRFVARDGIVAGQAMRRGDVILVVLAAANRDPEVNPDPELFRIHRDDPRMFSFGAGPHACPGVDLATTIAQAAVARLLADGVDLAALVGGAAYQPSANVRVPITELSEQEVSQR
jgi:cytochrome P450